MIRAALAVCLAALLIACSSPRSGAQPAQRADTVPATAAVESDPTPSGSATAAMLEPEPEPPRTDRYDLARRYLGLTITTPPLTQPPAARVGDTRSFFVYDLDANQAIEVQATLFARTEHADIWAQNGQRMSRADAERAGDAFESNVYPQVTAAFGLPAPAPGGAPGRIAILHAALRGAGGYFSEGDLLPRALVPYSNEQQMIYVDISVARPGERVYDGLVAHELQHLVHQQRNPYADTWFNEGLSEVADEMLGGANSYLRRFETAPETQLNAWPSGASTAPHYGAAHSFLRYLLRHYGGLDRAKDLSALGGNGVSNVERYLRAEFNTGFLDVFADWTVANLLDQDGDGRYSQPGINHRVRSIEKLPATGSGERSVGQFGTRYLEIEPNGRDTVLTFDGTLSVPRVNLTTPSSGAYWWSNRSDSMDSRLTRELDLRGVDRATLRFKLWFDIERDYDWGYVSASRDGGRTWQALSGRHTTDRDPLRVAYGPGYSGRSGGGDSAEWVDETIDLTSYAGSRILLRFEYVTDEATVADGLAIDEISVPEIGLRDGADSRASWLANGFLRVTGPLEQRFIVQLVEQAPDGSTTVRRITLDASNHAQIVIPGVTQKATVVVSGATLGTTEPATFRFDLRR
jgi:immune inhibitor A